MGYDLQAIRVAVRLSRHNTTEDKIHDQLFDDLLWDIEQLINEKHPEYKKIVSEVYKTI